MTPETRAQLIDVAIAERWQHRAQTNAVDGFRYCLCHSVIARSDDGGWASEWERHIESAVLDRVLAHRESIVCPTCGGTGVLAFRDQVLCRKCNGMGVLLGPTVLVERAEYEQVGTEIRWNSEVGAYAAFFTAPSHGGPREGARVFVLRSSNQSETP